MGFEGVYEVSDLGRVRSLHKLSSGLILNPLRHTGGYKRLMLWRGGVAKQVFIHALVLEAFVGPRPAGMQVAHSDGSKDNNALANLRWASPSENQADRERHGTGRVGKGSYVRKHIGATTARQLREAYATERITITALAKRFGLPRTTVADTINGRTWKRSA